LGREFGTLQFQITQLQDQKRPIYRRNNALQFRAYLRDASFNFAAFSHLCGRVARGTHNITWVPNGGLSVGFAAVSDGGDRNPVLILEIEEHAVVAAAEAESSAWWLELLYVAGAAGEVAIHAIENLQGGFAVDSTKISAGLRLPHRRDRCGR
jgi:hypothetical protein